MIWRGIWQRPFSPFLADSLNEAAIDHVIHDSMVINPFIEIYVLDEQGGLLAYFADPAKIKRTAVDIGPVHQFIGGGNELPLPHLGDDPRSLTARKPFSAAATLVAGKPGFLYVILGGELHDSAADMIRESYIIQATAANILVVAVCTAFVGLLSFLFLTRRLRRITDTVRRFRQGDWEQRVGARDTDELGELGVAFDEMADTIVSNMEQMKESDRPRREMVANISHDLRSPLTSVQGYIETILLREAEMTSADRRSHLETVSQNVKFLNRLVNELFELSKLESGQSAPRREPFSIEELAHDVTAKYQPQVYADIHMIERTLDNLIENALRFTPAKGQVRIQLEPGDRDIFVHVSDSGIGISPEELPHIFNRFCRVRRSPEGTGLGLAISRHIIEAHESTIKVVSRVKEGTTFSVNLALA